MSGCLARAAQRGAGRLRFRCRVAVHRLPSTPDAGAPARSRLEQRVDLRRTHDGAVMHEGFVVVVDGVAVLEVVHHDPEGFLDAACRAVAEPIDPFEPRAIAEVKTRHRSMRIEGGRAR